MTGPRYFRGVSPTQMEAVCAHGKGHRKPGESGCDGCCAEWGAALLAQQKEQG